MSEIIDFQPKKKTAGRLLAVLAGRAPGEPKRNVGQAQLVKNFGLSGDCDSGPKGRQLALLSQVDWQKSKEVHPDLSFGALGENLVVSLELAQLPKGARLRISDALIELTAYKAPLYEAKVVLAGIVTEGDPVVIE
ncbi:MAG: hypothetical protein LBV23_11530 [Deltaproteobacteria bacterium]|jgi:MOSC domain-containing protein YiiM|nr:hypothetical protein [Deltaproteobacteria bacterium]